VTARKPARKPARVRALVCTLCGRRSPARWDDRDPVTVSGWFDVGAA
jgi:hypothetical protein